MKDQSVGLVGFVGFVRTPAVQVDGETRTEEWAHQPHQPHQPHRSAGSEGIEPTPDTTRVDASELDRFITRLRARLDAGAREYGSTTFERPAAELIDEVMEELEDVAGWGFLLWLRLDRLRDHVARATAQGEHHE